MLPTGTQAIFIFSDTYVTSLSVALFREYLIGSAYLSLRVTTSEKRLTRMVPVTSIAPFAEDDQPVRSQNSFLFVPDYP